MRKVVFEKGELLKGMQEYYATCQKGPLKMRPSPAQIELEKQKEACQKRIDERSQKEAQVYAGIFIPILIVWSIVLAFLRI